MSLAIRARSRNRASCATSRCLLSISSARRHPSCASSRRNRTCRPSRHGATPANASVPSTAPHASKPADGRKANGIPATAMAKKLINATRALASRRPARYEITTIRKNSHTATRPPQPNEMTSAVAIATTSANAG